MEPQETNLKHVEPLNLSFRPPDSGEPQAPLAACDCDDNCGCDDICALDFQDNCGVWG